MLAMKRFKLVMKSSHSYNRVVSDVTDLPEQAKNMHHLPVLLIFLHFRGWDVFIK